MNAHFQLMAINMSFWTILLLSPLAVLFWRLPKGTTRISWRRFLGSVACGWILMILHRLFIEVPVLKAAYREAGNFEYDGVGGNAATIIGMWIPVLLLTVIYSVVAVLWWRIRKRDA